MGRVVAIDPGEWSGIAVFDDDVLIRAELVGKGRDGIAAWIRCTSIMTFGAQAVIEIPQVYQQKQWKGDPNDLMGVAYIAGMFGCWLQVSGAKVTTVRPHAWKGSRPKAVDIRYTLACLTGEEKTKLPRLPASKLHNVLDAVGIGLWQVKRR